MAREDIQKRLVQSSSTLVEVSVSVFKAIRPILTFVAVCLAVAGVAGCGGGTSGEVVAQVGASSITKAELNHWMTTEAGGDFYELSAGHTMPEGLVSEPPNYAACVTRLQAIAAKSLAKGLPKPTAGQLLSKCRQLHQELKLQALEFLVDTQWTIGAFGELGIKTTDGEVMQRFDRIKAEQFPRELQRYLGSRRRSLSDELLLVKINVLSGKAYQKLTGGGKQVIPKMVAKFTEVEQRWTTKTNCNPGYVVKHCKQYTGQPPPSNTSAAILLEQVAVITGRPCVNHPACD